MKLFGLILVGLLVVNTVVLAAGPYEVGRMTVDGVTCRWTSNIKQNCTKAAMQKKVKEMESCLSPRLEKETESCQNMKCVKEKIKNIATDCCNKTGGSIQ